MDQASILQQLVTQYGAAGSGDLSIPFRALVDFCMGVVLLRFMQGRAARWTGLSFIATMMLTGLAWSLGLSAVGQIGVLDALAFAQLGVIILGAWGDGISRRLAGMDFGAARSGGRYSDRPGLSGMCRAPEEEGRG